MNKMIYIDSVEPGAVTLTDTKTSDGHRALLGIGDVGCLLRVLSECRSEMKSLDGDFEFRRAKGDEESYDYMGRICGKEFGMSITFAHVLKCALERACLDISRTKSC